MRIRVLGSAAGGGFPQWNCGCGGCRRARAGDPAARPRTQSSLAVSADGERWALLNASPDLRAQIAANPPLHPAPGHGRHSPIAAVVLTNADVDHVAGLLSLRESQPFALHATPRVLGVLEANSLFRVLDPGRVPRRPMPLDAAVALLDAAGVPLGLTVEAFAVPGKVALYLEDPAAGPSFGSVPEDTVALRVCGPDGGGFFYVPGCAAVPRWLANHLTGAPLVFFDGTTWSEDEMIRTGTGTKTAGRMGHMPMSGPAGSLAALAPLGIARRVYIHINNTNPVLLDDSPERTAVEAAGWTVAHDGMEITA